MNLPGVKPASEWFDHYQIPKFPFPAIIEAIQADAFVSGQRKGMEDAIGIIMSGSFLHDESPERKWALAVTARINRARTEAR